MLGIVKESDFLDVYRIQPGALLYVEKYKYDKSYGSYIRIPINDNKTKTKRHKGAPGLRMVTDSIKVSKGTIPCGSFVIDRRPIVLVDKREFNFILKVNDGLSGNQIEMKKLIKMMGQIVSKY